MNLGRSFDAYQAFVLGCKQYWSHTLFADLRASYEERAGAGTRPRTADEAAALMADDTLYRYYGWLERHLQRLKYSGRHGLVPAHASRRGEIAARLDRPLPDGLLTLDEDLELPAYYTRVDIHQHPGGVWSDDLAGVIYERGARSTTPLHARHQDLHHRFTDRVLGRRRPSRLLDLGCGFGKSTRPFYRGCRDAEVLGVDIAAPCLRLAAANALDDQARNVSFRQARAEATGCEDGSFDVVTSTMLLHEMPPPAVERVLAESFRVLAPGGLMVHLDFLPADDPFLRFVHYGHARRNNEPYMRPLDEMDLEGALSAAGFVAVRVEPFEEAVGALASEYDGWRFPWVTIAAEKPA